MRVFVAVPLPTNLRDQLAATQRQIDAHIPQGIVRWVRPEQIHITYKFLGDITSTQTDRLIRSTRSACKGHSPFSVEVRGLGCFPNTRRPRVIWVGLQDTNQALADLQRALEGAAAERDFPRDERPFSPHLTLGRLKRRANGVEIRQVGKVVLSSRVGPFEPLPVTELQIIGSNLTPQGPEYRVLRHIALA